VPDHKGAVPCNNVFGHMRMATHALSLKKADVIALSCVLGATETRMCLSVGPYADEDARRAAAARTLSLLPVLVQALVFFSENCYAGSSTLGSSLAWSLWATL